MLMIIVSAMEDDRVRYEVEELYLKYSRNCYYEALNITKNEDNARDVMQIVFEKLILYLENHTLSEVKYPKAFLITMAKREAINFVKRADNSKSNLVDSFEEFEQTTDDDPLMNVLRLDQAREFLKKLDKIKPEYAQIIVLKCAKEFTNKEVGLLLGITPENVKNRYSRAKKAYVKLILGGGKNE